MFRLGAYADEKEGDVPEGSVLTNDNNEYGGGGAAAARGGGGGGQQLQQQSKIQSRTEAVGLQGSNPVGAVVHTQPSRSIQGASSVGAGGGAVGGVDQTDQASEHFSNYNQQVLSASALIVDNFKVPLKVHIRGIACIDLKSVHTLASNSPCVNMACGKFVCKTDVSVMHVAICHIDIVHIILSNDFESEVQSAIYPIAQCNHIPL